MTDAHASYAAAGVNIAEGDRAVELIAPLAKKATRPEVRGGLGGFAGLFALGKYKQPLLAAGSDGVGTKLAVAQAMDKHDTIGIDLVAMCVDDLVVCGAEPLFLQDYNCDRAKLCPNMSPTLSLASPRGAYRRAAHFLVVKPQNIQA